MILICDNKIILRDFIESDIEKRISWETTQTEWQLWDAPWEYEGLTDEQKENDLCEYVSKMQQWAETFKSTPDTQKRSGSQICTNTGDYIGWCNSYRIDTNYTYSKDGTKCAIGIDIPETDQRGNGYAFRALCLFIDYLTDNGESEIYTQTWSGNIRMISLAKKIGFELCSRKAGIRNVRGEKYDGLTFCLNRALYKAAKERL